MSLVALGSLFPTNSLMVGLLNKVWIAVDYILCLSCCAALSLGRGMASNSRAVGYSFSTIEVYLAAISASHVTKTPVDPALRHSGEVHSFCLRGWTSVCWEPVWSIIWCHSGKVWVEDEAGWATSFPGQPQVPISLQYHRLPPKWATLSTSLTTNEATAIQSSTTPVSLEHRFAARPLCRLGVRRRKPHNFWLQELPCCLQSQKGVVFLVHCHFLRLKMFQILVTLSGT